MARMSTRSLLIAALAFSPTLLFGCTSSMAQPAPLVVVDLQAVEMPLQSITLFSSGVGFFRHAGSVPAGGEVRLEFTADELNDALKSLTLSGASGGASVSYPGQADLDQRLGGFGVDLRGVTGRFDLLERLRGVKVSLTFEGGREAVQGRVLGVETRTVTQPKEGDPAEVVQMLTLATASGVTEANLAQVNELTVADERLANELKSALELLAASRDTRKKTLAVHFAQASDDAALSYLQASPLWKLSYRLDLSPLAQGESASLQGWAVVDNTTDRDWENVAVTLVSGRPVSFVQDLYSPEFLQRPVVEQERYAGLRPQRYEQDMEMAEEIVVERERNMRSMKSMPAMAAPSPMAAAADGDGGMGSVSAAATSGEMGELFAYTLSEPVTLARGDSAMLPIVQEGIAATPVSVYNNQVQAKHPMRGVRLTNSTALKLDAGPVTVLDGGTYAGDAQLDFLGPEADRLLTYAMDLEVLVDAQHKHRTVQTGGRFERGVLVVEQRQEQTVIYQVKNTASAERQVLIEHPRNTAFELVDPPADTETTGDLYRLPVVVPAGKSASVTAKETRVFAQSVALGRMNEAQLVAYSEGGAMPAKVKEQLKQASVLKRAIADAERALVQADEARDRIVQEQSRLRNNMKPLGRDSALYKRYVEKLNTQEDALEKGVMDRETLGQKLQAAREAFEAFVANLG